MKADKNVFTAGATRYALQLPELTNLSTTSLLCKINKVNMSYLRFYTKEKVCHAQPTEGVTGY